MDSKQIIQVQIKWQGWRRIMVCVPVDDLAWNINQSEGRIYPDYPDGPDENEFPDKWNVCTYVNTNLPRVRPPVTRSGGLFTVRRTPSVVNNLKLTKLKKINKFDLCHSAYLYFQNFVLRSRKHGIETVVLISCVFLLLRLNFELWGKVQARVKNQISSLRHYFLCTWHLW